MKRNPKIFQFVESGIRKKISSEIRNPRLWNPEYSFRKSWILLTTEIQCLEIRNPQRGIQNSRLSRFPLHEGGILLSASKIVFGRWNSKYTGRTSRTSPVADPGEGLVGTGTPLISGSGWPPSPPPPSLPPYLKVWISHCSRIYNFTFNSSSFSAIRAYFCQGKCNLWLNISISSSLLFSFRIYPVHLASQMISKCSSSAIP